MIETCLNESKFDLNEDYLCVDFVNTLDWRQSESPRETLTDYKSLVNWAMKTKLLSQSESTGLLTKAARNASQASAALENALRFRALLDEILAATSRGNSPKPSALKRFNEILHEAFSSLELYTSERGFTLEVCCQRDLASPIIWPIAISAAQLLTSSELNRIGICQDEDGCGYFFHDTSKNHSKKYCGTSCATRAKVRRFREKQRD